MPAFRFDCNAQQVIRMVNKEADIEPKFSLYLLIGITVSMSTAMLGLSVWFLDLGPSLDSMPPMEQAKTELLALNPALGTDVWKDEQTDDGTRITLRSPFLLNIEPLRGLAIDQLCLQGVRVRDLSPLSDVTSLYVLECSDNPLLESIAPLSKSRGLDELILSGTSVSDLAPIANIRLSVLDISQTPVDDLQPVSQMSLTSLLCGGSLVQDLSALSGMKTLEVIDVGDTPVSDLRPLMECSSLEVIKADTELIKSSDFLRQHPNRDRLRLNQISVEKLFSK